MQTIKADTLAVSTISLTFLVGNQCSSGQLVTPSLPPPLLAPTLPHQQEWNLDSASSSS